MVANRDERTTDMYSDRPRDRRSPLTKAQDLPTKELRLAAIKAWKEKGAKKKAKRDDEVSKGIERLRSNESIDTRSALKAWHRGDMKTYRTLHKAAHKKLRMRGMKANIKHKIKEAKSLKTPGRFRDERFFSRARRIGRIEKAFALSQGGKRQDKILKIFDRLGMGHMIRKKAADGGYSRHMLRGESLAEMLKSPTELRKAGKPDRAHSREMRIGRIASRIGKFPDTKRGDAQSWHASEIVLRANSTRPAEIRKTGKEHGRSAKYIKKTTYRTKLHKSLRGESFDLLEKLRSPLEIKNNSRMPSDQKDSAVIDRLMRLRRVRDAIDTKVGMQRLHARNIGSRADTSQSPAKRKAAGRISHFMSQEKIRPDKKETGTTEYSGVEMKYTSDAGPRVKGKRGRPKRQ